MDTSDTSDTSMTLTGVRSGLRIDASGTSGTLATGSSVSGTTGYAIAARETKEGLAYDLVSVVAEADVSDPPAVALSLTYVQTVAFAEVDLELRYTDIPDGTAVQVSCSQTEFDISRQAISGSSLIGSSGKRLDAFTSTIDLMLWIAKPGALKSTSSITLSLSKIEGGDGGPVKKVLLQKVALNLAAAPEQTTQAKTAELWSGIVVRCTTAESGQVPRNASSSSPDIILAGTSPLEDPTILTKPENYGNVYDDSLYIGLPNYLYVRGKNFTGGDLAGSWNLFWATPNILLYPYLWQDNKLATSSGNKNPPLAIAAGKIGASTDAFTWVPPDTSDHYCMIGLANTPGHGNPVEGVTNINSLAEVLSTNANIAQRNVHMVRGTLPQLVDKARYDQGSEGAIVDLAVLFENLPTGSSYTVSSGTPLNGKTLSHSETNTTDNDFKYAWANLDIPAQWNTMFNYTVTFGPDWSGIPSGKKPKVTIRGELVQEEGDPLYHLGRDAEPDPVTGEPRRGLRGGPVRLITVGSVSTMCPDMGP